MAPGPAALECRDLTVAYGAHPVLHNVNLTLAPGQTLAVLGPSGSGKTTLLYTIAGFVAVRGGEVWIDGRCVERPGKTVPPEDRRVGLVFQNYALWPHMTALDTVAYPIRRRGVSRPEAQRRAASLLERLGVGELAERRPAELSGGQQQRVGLARALAREAGLYLFDEPTAHLDAPLRAVVQEELAAHRAQMEAAVVYATHDAAEALAIADLVAVLRGGRVVQVATPSEIYERPVDSWVARLSGPASVLTPIIEARTDKRVTVRLGDHTLTVQGGGPPVGAGQRAEVLVRTDWARLHGPLPGVVVEVRYRGPHTDYRIDTGDGTLDIRAPGFPSAHRGDAIGWDLDRVWVLEEDA